MRKTGKKELKGERLRCGFGISASPACIPPCFVLLIAISPVVPKGGILQVSCPWVIIHPVCFREAHPARNSKERNF